MSGYISLRYFTLICLLYLSPPFIFMDSSTPHDPLHDLVTPNSDFQPLTPSHTITSQAPSAQSSHISTSPTPTPVITSQALSTQSSHISPSPNPAVSSQAPSTQSSDISQTPTHPITPAQSLRSTPHPSSSKRCLSTPRQSKGCKTPKKVKASTYFSKPEYKKCCKELILAVDHHNILEKFRYLSLETTEKAAVDKGLTLYF